MRKLLPLVFLTLGFSLAIQKATAQWNLFSQLLNQLDSTVYNQYLNNLNTLDTTWSVNHVNGNDLLNDLYDELGNPNPAGTLDASYINGLDAGLDTLLNHLPGFGLANADQDTLLGELEHIQNIFETNFDSLAGLFGQYQDSLSFDSTNWTVTILDFDNITEGHFNILQDTLEMLADTSPPLGPGNFASLIGKLFDEITFPDLEIAFGTQQANLKYWGERYGADAKVIRIGSVPRFNKTAMQCHDGILRLPIEARWHVEASWNGVRRPENFNDINNPNTNTNYINNQPVTNEKGFNPLLLSGDFAMMATPNIGRWGNTSFKIITSLGMEFGTYAPAHREYAPPFTSYNKGYATGFGPQAGAGFSMTTGSLVIYSLATIAHGDVVRCALPYRYNSRRFEAGMRFGNIINIRYSKGWVSWQENDNRLADIQHQVTVGIILKQLNH